MFVAVCADLEKLVARALAASIEHIPAARSAQRRPTKLRDGIEMLSRVSQRSTPQRSTRQPRNLGVAVACEAEAWEMGSASGSESDAEPEA